MEEQVKDPQEQTVDQQGDPDRPGSRKDIKPPLGDDYRNGKAKAS
jgi:hypothetical protein